MIGPETHKRKNTMQPENAQQNTPDNQVTEYNEPGYYFPNGGKAVAAQVSISNGQLVIADQNGQKQSVQLSAQSSYKKKSGFIIVTAPNESGSPETIKLAFFNHPRAQKYMISFAVTLALGLLVPSKTLKALFLVATITALALNVTTTTAGNSKTKAFCQAFDAARRN